MSSYLLLRLAKQRGCMASIIEPRRSLSITGSKFTTDKRPHQTSNISYSETEIFRENANKWWTGKEFVLLRGMNELRVPLIRNGLIEKQGKQGVKLQESSATPLKGYKIIDVGCGGGILSEPLARLGANVLGVDPVHESIVQAQQHAQLDKAICDQIEYRNCNIEDVVSEKDNLESYDAVVASEVLEHIRDIEGFLKQCTKAIKPNGSLFLTTINQTPLAYLGVILFGEYILQQLPKGTHTYDMFVNLVGLKIMLERMGYHLRLVNGFMYEPITGKFLWTPTTLTHYAIHAIKTTPQASSPKATSSSKSVKNNQASINYEQKRHYTSVAKIKRGKSSSKAQPKVSLSDDEMMPVVPIDAYRLESQSIVAELKENFEKNLTSRMALLSVDNVEINLMENSSELANQNQHHKRSSSSESQPAGNLFKLKDVAQITKKGSNLIVINLNAMPQALKPTMTALSQLGNLNPQVEGNSIYLPLPRVTREHREKLVEASKRATTKAKSEIKVLFASYSTRAKRQQTKASLSSDLVRNTIDFMQCEMHNTIELIDNMLKDKTDNLLTSSQE